MRDSDRSLVCAIRGPITLITLGVLFALNNFTPYAFHQTWPVLLIVFGLLTLLRRSVEPPIPAYAPPPSNYPPPYTPPQTGAQPGGFRQTPYAESGSGPAKGGFGSTKSGDSGENPGGAV